MEAAEARAAELRRRSRVTRVRRDRKRSKGSAGYTSEANRTCCIFTCVVPNGRSGRPKRCGPWIRHEAVRDNTRRHEATRGEVAVQREARRGFDRAVRRRVVNRIKSLKSRENS